MKSTAVLLKSLGPDEPIHRLGPVLSGEKPRAHHS